MDPKRLEKLQAIQDWELDKPSTDEEWVEDVKTENLDVKFDYQLQEMLDSHSDKVLKVEKDFDVFTNWPQVKTYEFTQQFTQMFEDQGNPADFEGKTLQQWIDEEFESQQLTYTWKVAKLNQSVERIAKEIELRASGYLEVKDDRGIEAGTFERIDIDKAGSKIRSPLGTTYYIDATNGSAANNGLTTGTAYLDLDNFTEVARSAGDKAILRRGLANNYDDGTDLLFTSDGTIDNPIIIEADFDNAFSDQVDLSVTATATLTFGSKTVTFSADISSVLAAGDWIYASGDDNRNFAYEVASVVTTTVTLFLPYKGDQAGVGKTMFNMQDNPIWNTAAGDFQWNFDTDFFWKIQGIHIRGTDLNGVIELDDSFGHLFKDCVFQGNGAGDFGINTSDFGAGWAMHYDVYKSRFYNYVRGLSNLGGIGVRSYTKDCLFDGNSVAASVGIVTSRGLQAFAVECEFKNHATGDIGIGSSPSKITYLRNSILSSTTEVDSHIAANTQFNRTLIEDHDGILNDTRELSYFSNAEGTPIFQSETTIVRSGGSNKSIKVTPSASISSRWEMSNILLFELPIYATTASKQYDIYFRPNTTAEWSADPTASELWIELEAWGHATNNFRKITKSTGVIDMNGSTAWQALTVTVAPAQAGVAYLRAYYAKTKEAGANVFFVDPIPVIT